VDERLGLGLGRDAMLASELVFKPIQMSRWRLVDCHRQIPDLDIYGLDILECQTIPTN
jgi:hypothetical protein